MGIPDDEGSSVLYHLIHILEIIIYLEDARQC